MWVIGGQIGSVKLMHNLRQTNHPAANLDFIVLRKAPAAGPSVGCRTAKDHRDRTP